MKPLGRLEEHVLLVKRMARATDVDLCQAYEDGTLSPDAWADLVQTCRGCRWADRCATWLDTHDHQGCAPQTCVNRARLETVRRAQEEA